jgi:YesN/AraC family two-component response regulator
MHCTLAADYKSVESLLNDLYVENFTNRKLSVDIIKQLIENMNCTIIKLYANIAGKNTLQGVIKLDRFKSYESIEEIFNHIKRDYMRICDIYRNNKKSHNKELIGSITEYIDTNYTKSDLCISIIAKKFNLSEAYLSQFFKEQTGQNFTTYVENIRIRAACELLLRFELPIVKIAQNVGYNSPHVFRSAFKRVIGINPVAYRDNKKLTTQAHTQ